MNSKEYRNQVEHFMEEKGLKPCVFELFETDIVKEKIKERYDLYSSKMQDYIQKAPEELAQNVEDLKKSMEEYTYDQFLDDIRVSFMAKQYTALNITFVLFGDNIGLHNYIVEEVKKNFNTDNESALKDIEESADGCLKELLHACLGMLYANYIPEDVPTELIPLFKMIAGENFTIVPANAIFSEPEDTSETEENSEQGEE